MKIVKYYLSPLIYGTWVLRITNDKNFHKDFTYIKIDEEPIIKIKSIQDNNYIGIKKSMTAFITELEQVKNKKNTYKFKLNFSTNNFYSYSFLGIQIPEIWSKTELYDNEKKYNLELFDKNMIITYKDYYYIFDLSIGQLKYPNIETNINTFMFTQIFSIILNLFIMNFFI